MNGYGTKQTNKQRQKTNAIFPDQCGIYIQDHTGVIILVCTSVLISKMSIIVIS